MQQAATPAPAGETVLEARAVSRRFGAVVAVDGVDLSVRRGEVHALLGENGAGKSTLIRLLAGIMSPTTGDVLLRGRPLTAAANRGTGPIGVVFQELALIPDLTVAENLLFGLEARTKLGTVAGRDLRRRAQRQLDDLGIDGIPVSAKPRTLSLAQRQLIEIARVVAVPRDVVILDEATSALSPHEVDWLLKQARRLADSGVAVLFISHRLGEIRRAADRISVLRNGQKVGERLRGQYQPGELVELMLNRRVERMFPARPAAGRAVGRPLLAVRDLRWSPRGAINLDVHAGEILGLGGLAGQGQTELLEALAGARQAKGHTTVDGQAVRLASPRAAMRRGPGITLIPEDRRHQGLMGGRSITENIALPILGRLSNRGLTNPARERDAARTAADRLRIACSSLDQPVAQLSGGNQQKVVMAKALATQAKILLLHDPTRGVDVGTKSEIFQLMRKLADDGYALVFYSTDTTELLNVADRVAVLVDSRVADILEGDRLTEQDLIQVSLSGSSE
jgi:ribose transport system ATP-binding protein